MRDLQSLSGRFDAVINLWQSFGYFDADTNSRVFSQMCDKIKQKGRLILDIYHREFFMRFQGARKFEKHGVSVVETRTISGDRLHVDLEYGTSKGIDHFDWQLYTPTEIKELARSEGLIELYECSDYDINIQPTELKPRTQFVFEKT
jgi:hypothetical protein